MKILVIHNYYQVKGGEDIVVQNECELLKEHGHKVFSYIRHNDETEKYNIFQKLLFPLRTFFSIKTILDLRLILKSFNPDIVHVHNIFPLISPSVYIYFKFMRVPVIQTVHNYRFICANGLFYIDGQICERCYKITSYPVIKKCYKNSSLLSLTYSLIIFFYRFSGIYSHCISKFICLNEFARQKMIKGGYPKAKLKIKHNYVDTKNVNKDIPNKKNYCLFLGRLSHEKGILNVLNAFKSINNIKLTIAGYGPLETFVKECENDIVSYIGFIDKDEKIRLINESQFMIVPSICYEAGIPLSILEANIHGTCVLASRIGAIPEIVKNDITGLLFETGNPKDLASKIQYLAMHPDLCKRMGENARQYVMKYYFKENSYKSLINIYKDALAYA